MKKMLKNIFYFIIPFLGNFFFDRQYLTGKHFSKYGDGWWWVYKALWFQKVLGFNRHIPFPISPTFRMSDYRNIVYGSNNMNNFQSPGVYFQNFSAKIILGDNVYIAPNVGIITANHDFENLNSHVDGLDVIIGNNCWIGMNAVILPGVRLANNIIVGAGAVVTKSFTEENIVIGGNPARFIKKISE